MVPATASTNGPARTPATEWDVFVSYAPGDKRWVMETLLPRLEGAGLAVLLPERDFAPGRTRLENLEAAIDSSRFTLAVMTPDWLDSGWNEFESLLVQDTDVASRRQRLLPLLLEPCLLPSRIRMLTYADLTGSPEQDAEQLDRVLAAVQKRSSVFVAYVPEIKTDHMFATYLRRSLEGQGHQAYTAADVLPGFTVEESRHRRMQQCEYVVVLMSAESLRDERLLAQLAAARDLGINRILPVRVNYEGSLPAEVLAIIADRSTIAWITDQDPDIPARLLLDTINEFARFERTRLEAKAKLWPPGSLLTMAFLDGAPALQWRVAKVMSEWLEFAHLRLRFSDDPGAPLRVSFKLQGSWAYMGTDALRVAPGQPTINFGWLTADTAQAEVNRVVRHEFGHVLGLIHEHQMPDAAIPWNEKKVYKFYAGPTYQWTRQAIQENVLNRVDRDFFHVPKPFDPQSIMMFPIPKELTTGGYEVGWNTELSAIDKEFVAKLYPAR